MFQPIISSRLTLASMGPEVINALLQNDTAAAGRLMKCNIPAQHALNHSVLAMRLNQLRENPSVQPWLLRGMIERSSATMVGHIGFHTSPRADYLADFAADAVELGYTTYSPFRRRGFATEACLALMHWAFSRHDQKCFVLSISPQNVASTTMAESLGFARYGSHVDDQDGVEIEFLRRFETWPPDWDLRQSSTNVGRGSSLTT